MTGYHSVLQLLQEELYSGEWTPPTLRTPCPDWLHLAEQHDNFNYFFFSWHCVASRSRTRVGGNLPICSCSDGNGRAPTCASSEDGSQPPDVLISLFTLTKEHSSSKRVVLA